MCQNNNLGDSTIDTDMPATATELSSKPQKRGAITHVGDTVELFGVTMNNMCLSEFLNVVDKLIESRLSSYVVTPNVDHICQLQTDKKLQSVYEDASLVLPDGMPLLWAGKLCGKPIKEKLSGSDLVYWLTEHASKKGYSIFFLGAEEGIAELASKELYKKYPGFDVAGFYSPPLGFEKNPVEIEKVCTILQEAKPDICYVAFGTPKQDYFNYDYCAQLGIPCMLGIGASLDFVAGKTKRAPVWMQRWGLEWLWRLFQEPRRLWYRYLVQDSVFILLLCQEVFRNRIYKYKSTSNT